MNVLLETKIILNNFIKNGKENFLQTNNKENVYLFLCPTVPQEPLNSSYIDIGSTLTNLLSHSYHKFHSVILPSITLRYTQKRSVA